MYEKLVVLLRKKYDKAPMVMEAADAIEELSKQIKAVQCVNIGDLDCDNNQLCTCMGIVRKRLDADAKRSRWIPVTERLPEERINPKTREIEEVLCATTHGAVRLYKYGARFGLTEPHFWLGHICVDVSVTHWQELPPLPKPPKEDA